MPLDYTQHENFLIEIDVEVVLSTILEDVFITQLSFEVGADDEPQYRDRPDGLWNVVDLVIDHHPVEGGAYTLPRILYLLRKYLVEAGHLRPEEAETLVFNESGAQDEHAMSLCYDAVLPELIQST